MKDRVNSSVKETMLIKVQMVCRYEKNRDNDAEMNDRAQSTGPRHRQPGPHLSLVRGCAHIALPYPMSLRFHVY